MSAILKAEGPSPLTKLIVVADDLSGAAELAGIAFAHGLSAEVQRTFDSASEAETIAIDADSRGLPAVAAAQRVQQLTEQVMKHCPAILFKKVDSVLRGNPRAEIEAILKVTGQRRALLIPANPSRGRVIHNGRYFINGVPLDQTPFGADPEHGACASDVKSLLGDSGDLPVTCINVDSLLPPTGLIVPDVSNAADLIARVNQADKEMLLAGAADCFASLLLARGLNSRNDSRPIIVTPPVLLVCGSAAAWPIRRDQCLAAAVPVATIGQESPAAPCSGSQLLGIGEPPPGISQNDLLTRLAEAAAAMMLEAPIQTILAEGGATAAAIAERMGWTRFAVVTTAPVGVGVLRPLSPPAPLLLIKPGSYAWPVEIWRALCTCTERT